MCTDNKNPKIEKKFIIQDYEENKILFNEDNQDINILNKVAWEVFSLLNGKHSIEDISIILHKKYINQDLEMIKADVNEILLQFKEMGFFDIVSEQVCEE